jgi:hypothetical protein
MQSSGLQWVSEQRTPSNSDCACARSVCHRPDVSRPLQQSPTAQPCSANNMPPDVFVSTENDGGAGLDEGVHDAAATPGLRGHRRAGQ